MKPGTPFTTKDLAVRNVLLVDYNNLAMRAFYGSRSLTTPIGRPCNAVFAMLRMTRVILDTYRTFAVIMVCDDGFPAFRTTLTKKWGPGYKTSRKLKPQPGIEDARKQREWAKELFKLLGVVFVSSKNYEADDVVAWSAYALATSEPNFHSLVWSNDKDLHQLIGKHVSVVVSGEGEPHLLTKRDPYMLLRRAVVGDKSDDVIGVRGVGDKKFDVLVEDLAPIRGRPSHRDFLKLVEDANPSNQTATTVKRLILESRARVLDNMRVSDLRVTYRKVGGALTIQNPLQWDPKAFRSTALHDWGFRSLAGTPDAFSDFIKPYEAMWRRGCAGEALARIQEIPF